MLDILQLKTEDFVWFDAGFLSARENIGMHIEWSNWIELN